MSIMFVKIRSVSRGQGGSAVAKAAYIARDRIRDDRTGVTHDYRATPGLEHAEIILPTGTDAETAAWTRERGSLWNGAEKAEARTNARVAREYTLALPHELSAENATNSLVSSPRVLRTATVRLPISTSMGQRPAATHETSTRIS